MPAPENPLSLALLLVPVVVLSLWAGVVVALVWFGRRRARKNPAAASTRDRPAARSTHSAVDDRVAPRAALSRTLVAVHRASDAIDGFRLIGTSVG